MDIDAQKSDYQVKHFSKEEKAAIAIADELIEFLTMHNFKKHYYACKVCREEVENLRKKSH